MARGGGQSLAIATCHRSRGAAPSSGARPRPAAKFCDGKVFVEGFFGGFERFLGGLEIKFWGLGFWVFGFFGGFGGFGVQGHLLY